MNKDIQKICKQHFDAGWDAQVEANRKKIKKFKDAAETDKKMLNALKEQVEANKKELNTFKTEAKSTKKELVDLRALLKESNDLLRSVNAVIEREGNETNWTALNKQTKRILTKQYSVLYKQNGTLK